MSTKNNKKNFDAGNDSSQVVGAAQHSHGITVEDILRGTAHALTIFKPKTISGLSIFLKRGKPYLNCYASGKDRH